MVEQVLINADDYSVPDANLLITEDDTPVDNFASARQQRLLVGSLYSSLQDQTFLAEANVGIYHTDGEAAIVPDVFISFDVQTPENWWEKQNRCYLLWKFGKVPEVVVEIVSNKEGEELGKKLRIYEKMRVIYYIVYDPTQQLGDKTLRVYRLNGRYYRETQETWLEQVGLGVTLWTGEFEGRQDNWLRWCYQDGSVLATGDELAQREKLEKQQAQQLAQQERLEKEQAQQLAQQERLEKEQAQQLAQQERLEKEQAQQLAQQERLEREQAQQRAQLLAQRLLSLGIDPENFDIQ